MREDLLCTQYGFGMPTQNYSNARYLPDEWEDILWSSEVLVPRAVLPRLSYRIREDYYKVKEIYDIKSKQKISMPNDRFLGTDIIVSAVDGDFAIVKEHTTGIEHRIYYKFLRMLKQGEPFVPNKWVFRKAQNTGGAKRVILDPNGTTPRFAISLSKNSWVMSINILYLKDGKRAQKRYTKEFESVEEAVLEGLTWSIEEYGQYNNVEIELYNSLITETTKQHPYIEHVLNYSS